MKPFSALLALCVGNSPVTGEFPSQWPVMQRFDVFFDLRLNKRLSKQSWSWWFETPSTTLWRHCNDVKRCAPALFISNITVSDERVNCNDQDIFISLAYNIITEDFNIIKSETKWTKCFPYYHLSIRTTAVSVDGVTWVHVGQKKNNSVVWSSFCVFSGFVTISIFLYNFNESLDLLTFYCWISLNWIPMIWSFPKFAHTMIRWYKINFIYSHMSSGMCDFLGWSDHKFSNKSKMSYHIDSSAQDCANSITSQGLTSTWWPRAYKNQLDKWILGKFSF